mmetsp:Transcript_68942/g.223481  ORF Transcript_68942/g.223481 Transcript_68942/m.223481 type:complete len:134 (+) Transcript_68942:568-969(+)
MSLEAGRDVAGSRSALHFARRQWQIDRVTESNRSPASSDLPGSQHLGSLQLHGGSTPEATVQLRGPTHMVGQSGSQHPAWAAAIGGQIPPGADEAASCLELCAHAASVTAASHRLSPGQASGASQRVDPRRGP